MGKGKYFLGHQSIFLFKFSSKEVRRRIFTTKFTLCPRPPVCGFPVRTILSEQHKLRCFRSRPVTRIFNRKQNMVLLN
jgi:hypothetical protein